MATYNMILPEKRTGQMVAILGGKFGEVWRSIGTEDSSYWEVMRKVQRRGISIGEHELGYILLRLIEERLVSVLPNVECSCKECVE